MGYKVSQGQMDALFKKWEQDRVVYAPKRFVGGGPFSDTDCVRYAPVHSIGEVEFEEKSRYSFKEVLTPVSQTLFYFTEDAMKEADGPVKGAVIFLRSCDLHALSRLDAMYLRNGPEDPYYRRLRDKLTLVLMGCSHSYENCFCVSMGTNQSTNYDLSVDRDDDGYAVDCRDDALAACLAGTGAPEAAVSPAFVTRNAITVTIPDDLTPAVAKSGMWAQYDTRCINCGRCNFVCPTCTCFTMQDLFYSENGRVGERRRVQASCMVDGFTDVAGGGSYRRKNGERMRFKVLHKVLDHRKRFGENMCVGCGRCDDICPEYISFSHCVNQLGEAMKEVTSNDAQ